MKILVTGATGAIGKRVVPRLVALGHDVTAVSRAPQKSSLLQQQGATPVQVDLFDALEVVRAVEGHDTIINLATRIPAGPRVFLPWAWRENDRIRRKVSANLVFAGLAAGSKRLIQESFAPAYPDHGDEWIDETTDIAPARYSRSLLDSENAARQFSSRGSAGVILRFGLFYGRGDQFVDTAVDSIRRGWSPFLGRKSAFIAMISHDDAAAAVVAALGVPSGTYNVVDDPVRRGDLAESVAKALGVRSPRHLPAWVTWLAGGVGRTIGRSLRVSNRKLREASHWRPSFANTIEGWLASI